MRNGDEGAGIIQNAPWITSTLQSWKKPEALNPNNESSNK